MTSLNESKKRDFVNQLIVLIEQNAQLLTDAGFDPAAKVAQLKQQAQEADAAEAKQQEAKAAAKDATNLANQTLNVAYKDASATVDLITGLLGKSNNLVLEIKKMRK